MPSRPTPERLQSMPAFSLPQRPLDTGFQAHHNRTYEKDLQRLALAHPNDGPLPPISFSDKLDDYHRTRRVAVTQTSASATAASSVTLAQRHHQSKSKSTANDDPRPTAADSCLSVATRASSGATKSRSKSVFKRVIRTLTGGSKESDVETIYALYGESKGTAAIYGRGGAGRIKKPKKSRSDGRLDVSSAVSGEHDDDLRSLNSASSAVVRKAGKSKHPVFDPYLKSFVGPNGEHVPPLPPLPPISTTPPFELSFSVLSSPPAELPVASTYMSRSAGAGSIQSDATNSGLTQASSHTGWDAETKISHRASGQSRRKRSELSDCTSDRHGEDPVPMFSSPTGSMKWGYLPGTDSSGFRKRRPRDLTSSPPISPRRHTESTEHVRQAVDQASATASAPGPPPSMPLPPLPPSPTHTLDLTSLQTLYGALLAHQTAAPTQNSPTAVSQPIIPPHLASNLDSVIAVATAYQQLLNSLAATALADGITLQPSSPARTRPLSRTQSSSAHSRTPSDSLGVQSVGLGQTRLLRRNSSATASLKSSSFASSAGGGIAALSPPPHQNRQAMMEYVKSDGGTYSEQITAVGGRENRFCSFGPSPFSTEEDYEQVLWLDGGRDLAQDTPREKAVGAKCSGLLPSPLLREDMNVYAVADAMSSRLSVSSPPISPPMSPPASPPWSPKSWEGRSNPQTSAVQRRTPITPDQSPSRLYQGSFTLSSLLPPAPLASSSAQSFVSHYTAQLRSGDGSVETCSSATSSLASMPRMYREYAAKTAAKSGKLSMESQEEAPEPPSGQRSFPKRTNTASVAVRPFCSRGRTSVDRDTIPARLNDGEYQRRALPPTPPQSPPRPKTEGSVVRARPTHLSIPALRLRDRLDTGTVHVLPSPLSLSPGDSPFFSSPPVPSPTPSPAPSPPLSPVRQSSPQQRSLSIPSIPCVMDYNFPMPPTTLPTSPPPKGSVGTALPTNLRVRTTGELRSQGT